MRKLLNNENGYALFLAIAVVLIFTILGFSMITITTNSVKKNEMRQATVQATDLADKGVELAVKDIQKALEDATKTPISKDEFVLKLDKYTTNNSKMACPNNGSVPTDGVGVKLPGNNGTVTKVCIAAVDFVTNSNKKFINGVDNYTDKALYKRLVTFKSFGLSNGKQAISTYAVILGTDAVPDQLRYAVSSNDGGDLYLFGGVHVQGDIKSAGNIYINKYAYMSSLFKPTSAIYPLSMSSDANSVMPKIILPNKDKRIKYYEVSSGAPSKLTTYIPKKEINPSDTDSDTDAEKTLENQILYNTPNISLITKETPSDTVDIKGEITKAFNNNLNGTIVNEITNSNISTYNKNSNNVVIVGTKTYNSKDKTYTLTNGNGIKLTINATLQGKYYVQGNVTIDGGSNEILIKNNAILYVDGNVTISKATLQGISPESTLFIFATGTINTIYISNQKDTPSIIQGFFYSKDDMEIYGVYSNIIIQGGIAAKNLNLNAVRGDYNGSTTKLKNSRLQVIYDGDLIKKYTTFKRDEQTESIIQLNKPEIIDRQ